MNNKIYNLIFVGITTLASHCAAAAETAHLAITGTISTSACTPMLTIPIIALGEVEYDSLSIDGSPLLLPRQSTSLVIACPTPTLIAWSVIDNREGTAGPGGRDDYGLGLAESQMLGWYDILLSGSEVDGSPGSVIVRVLGPESGWASMAQSAQAVKHLEYSVAATSQPTTPIAGSLVEYQLNIDVRLQSKAYLTLTADAELDGSATFSLIYL